MNVYIIDWGENCNGKRYALLAALDRVHLSLEIDAVGDPSGCKCCNLGEWLFENGEEENYLELGTEKECYTNSLENLAKQMPWKNVIDTD